MTAVEEALTIDRAYRLGEISREEHRKLIDDLERALYDELYETSSRAGTWSTMTGWCLAHCYLRSIDDSIATYRRIEP